MKIPKQDLLVSLIDTASQQSKPRPHLGASLLGHPCDRWLWLSFRWAVVEKFSPRILRLFSRGHKEEEVLVRLMRKAGIDIRNTTSGQSRVNFGNHVSGSADGIIYGGISDLEENALVEFKTHSDKSFHDLQKNGVEKSKPAHFIQMNLYMHGLNLKIALYISVNKNDDSIYTERVRYDEDVATKYIKRGHRITSSERLPEPLSVDPTWWQCKWCAAYDFCHVGSGATEDNCRNCAHSTPESDSTWRCDRHNDTIPTNHQHDGCKSHVIHPELIPQSWRHKRGYGNWSAIYEVDGKEIVCGEEGFRYGEILANLDACLDPDVVELRGKFDGRIVG